MFVKIKLEDPGNSKTPLIFSIDDNAKVFDLKSNLESFVDIPADQQEIQRMDRILDNFDELSKVVNKEIDGDKINGAAISLYTNNKFFCFLQFYNKNESDNQSHFFSQPSDAKRLPIDQLPHYIEHLDSESSWHSSSSSESDSTDQSSNSSDLSEDLRSPKRKSLLKPNPPTKRLRSPTEDIDKRCEPTSTTVTPIHQATPIQKASEVKIPASTPVQSAATLASHTPAEQGSGTKNIVVVEVAPQATVPFTNIVLQTTTSESSHNPKEMSASSYTAKEPVQTSSESSLNLTEKPATSYIVMKPVQTTTSESSHNSKEKKAAPYVAMKPEQRRYAVVINRDIDEQQPDFGRLMEHFYGLFESSRSCGQLNFSESPSITAHDDQLWVLCEDYETCEWIATGARILSSYKCRTLIKYFGLLKCRVVLPQVVDGKELANIFHLLELQNLGLCTNKWCVVERTLLDSNAEDYATQAITTLCKNEVLTLYVDLESKRYIQEQGNKLKYCFWKLTFQF
ncbi:hypothetical protein ACLKA7_010295 [Drosophila subpalustris]